ncbi:MAG: hypothetical protein AAF004_07665 [Pseudomonadota bacterium]
MTGSALLKQQARLLRRAQLLRYGCFCMPIAALTFVWLLPRGARTAVIWAVVAWLLTTLLVDVARRRVRVTRSRLAMWLDREFSTLQDSTGLLLERSTTMTAVASLQKSRTSAALMKIHDEVSQRLASRRTWLPAFAFGLLLTAAIANAPIVAQWLLRPTLATTSDAPPPAAAVWDVQYDVQPPAYMGIAPYSVTGTDVTVPDGAKIRVTVTGEGFEALRWQSAGADSVRKLYGRDGRFQSEWWQASETTYEFTNNHAVVPTVSGQQVHRIALTLDTPPTVEIVTPDSRVQSVGATTPAPITVTLQLTDDFGVRDVIMQVMRSEGDGEQVRFEKRSQSIWQQGDAPARATTLQHLLDVESLGLTQGTELYINFVAEDIRLPEALRTESATLIVRWPRPESAADIVLDNQIVDVLPEYFRSQRQIIIDTEALIAERDANEVERSAFVARAQALALDQRALRLRYGTFMGEEDSGEPSAGASALQSAAGHYAGDGHDHDEDFFANARTGVTDFGNSAAAIEPYAHFHDQEEQATIFDRETRELLRQVLSAMWWSEGELRQYTLPPSLPYQYQALALIKKVQNRSRVFVQRVGFEPRPIDFGRRLTGELDELQTRKQLDVEGDDASPLHDADVTAAMAELLRSSSITPDIIVDPIIEWLASERQLLDDENSNETRVAFLDAQATLQSWRAQGTCDPCRKTLTRFWRQHAPSVAGLPSRTQGPLNVFSVDGDGP